MIAPPERSAERDAALEAMLPLVPTYGWTFAGLRIGLARSGIDPREAELLFPGGVVDMIEAFLDRADRALEAAAGEVAGLRTGPRVRALLVKRFAHARPDKEAVRRAFAILSLPRNLRVAARCTARTVDTIWYLAGDKSADFSWYTKRATLAAIYSATLLFWLRDVSEDDAPTLAFLDRRLSERARLGQAIERAELAVEQFAGRFRGRSEAPPERA
jgi:ubiquinone biosynthesis protein COQ9